MRCRSTAQSFLPVLLTLAGLLAGGCSMHAPDLPTPISNNAVASVIRADGTWSVFSFMGITDPTDPSTITPASYRLDSGARAWRSISDAPLDDGKARIGASAVTVAGKVYLIGGYSVRDDAHEVTEKRLFRYDEAADTFTELAPVAVEVDDTLASVYADRYIVLVSGWHGPINDNVSDVQLYDAQTDRWLEGTPLPGRPLFGHSGGITGQTILVMDGVARAEDGFEISRVVHVGSIDPDDPTRISWESIENRRGRPTYRAACSATHASSGEVLVLGGTDTPYNISGTGYNGEPCEPLNQLLAFNADSGRFRARPFPTGAEPTMDHRGLVPLGDGRWMVVGGMTAPGEASARARILRLRSQAED